MDKFQNLRERAQKLKASKKMKKQAEQEKHEMRLSNENVEEDHSLLK